MGDLTVAEWILAIGTFLFGGGFITAVIGWQRSRFNKLEADLVAEGTKRMAVEKDLVALKVEVTNIEATCVERRNLVDTALSSIHRMDKTLVKLAVHQGLDVEEA